MKFLFLVVGMDAQVSYAFHSERKLHPEKFKNQLVNQVLLFSFKWLVFLAVVIINLFLNMFFIMQTTYAKLGCTQGWFCASLLHPSSR